MIHFGSGVFTKINRIPDLERSRSCVSAPVNSAIDSSDLTHISQPISQSEPSQWSDEVVACFSEESQWSELFVASELGSLLMESWEECDSYCED